jgi:acetyltransferase-like isoleucine patch superfamily enzyme
MEDCKIIEASIVDVSCGRGVIIMHPSNLYGCTLDDNVFVGPFVEIQKGARVGKNTRIQSHSFICELVSIGCDCVIAHGVMFINDSFSDGGPARGDRTMWKKTEVGDNVSIGSNATILPVRICSNVVIGAGSVVTKEIKTSGIYAGNPARFLRRVSDQPSQ